MTFKGASAPGARWAEDADSQEIDFAPRETSQDGDDHFWVRQLDDSSLKSVLSSALEHRSMHAALSFFSCNRCILHRDVHASCQRFLFSALL